MSINGMPYPEQENYEDFKTWSNANIKCYEITSVALIKDLNVGAWLNVNMKMKADNLGITTDILNCKDLEEDLEKKNSEEFNSH